MGSTSSDREAAGLADHGADLEHIRPGGLLRQSGCRMCPAADGGGRKPRRVTVATFSDALNEQIRTRVRCVTAVRGGRGVVRR